MTKKTIEVNDVGPIRHVSIPIDPEGGVVVLRGPNGAGKTIGVECVGALVRGDGKLPKSIRMRDPAPGEMVESGEIIGLGRKIRVGLARNTLRGELEVHPMDDSIDLSQLVDPGLKDPVAADNRRIQAALVLAGIGPELSEFSGLLGSEAELRQVASPETAAARDPVSMADSLRRDLHERARAEEERAAAHEARVVALRDALGSDEEQAKLRAAQPLADAQVALMGFSADLSDLQRKAREWEKAQDSWERATRVLETTKDSKDPDTIQSEVLDLEKSLAVQLEVVNDIRRTIAERKVQLEAARQSVAVRESAQATLDYCAGLWKPDMNVLAKASEKVQEQQEAVRVAALADEFRAREAKSAAEKAAAERAAKIAAEYREAAAGTRQVLARLLARHAPEGLGIYGDRLVVDTDGKRRFFAELSDGERWKIALDLAIEALGDDRVMWLDQTAWEGLDGDARAAIVAHAKSRKTTIVTAEADHGPVGVLRAEAV